MRWQRGNSRFSSKGEHLWAEPSASQNKPSSVLVRAGDADQQYRFVGTLMRLWGSSALIPL